MGHPIEKSTFDQQKGVSIHQALTALPDPASGVDPTYPGMTNNLDTTVRFIESTQITVDMFKEVNPATGEQWNHILYEPDAGGCFLSDRLRNLVAKVVRGFPEVDYINLNENDPDVEARYALPARLAGLHDGIDALTTYIMAADPNRIGWLDPDELSVLLVDSTRRYKKLQEHGFDKRPWLNRFPLYLSVFDGFTPPNVPAEGSKNVHYLDCTNDITYMASLLAFNAIQLSSREGHQPEKPH